MGIKKETFKNIKTDVRAIVKENNKIVSVTDYGPNLIVNSGKRSILDRLRNVGNTNEGVITYGVVGTDNTIPNVSQTTLVAELARKVVAQDSRSQQTATFRVFFAKTEATGTLKEFAWFGGGVNGDATSSADSGTMINRILIDETVTDSQTLTIEQDFTW